MSLDPALGKQDPSLCTQQPTASPQEMRRYSFSAFMGGLLEFYDFGLYGWAAAVVFQPLFFAGSSPTVGLLAAFATFGVGFVVRPLGGVLFGHLGDRVSRKSMMLLTLGLMGVSTFLVGLLPTYADIGVWAVVLLVLLRFVQGVAVGGEFGGATMITAEHAPPGRRGFWSSFVLVGAPMGLVVSSLVFTLFSTMPEEQFMSWGWRVPFLLSAVIAIFGVYFRRKVSDPAVFQAAREREPDRVPISELFRNHKWLMLRAVGARLCDAPTANVFSVFAVSYITHQLGGSATIALLTGLATNGVLLILVPFTGALSDRIGRKPVILAGAAAMIVTPTIGFAIMQSGSGWILLLGVVVAWPLAGALIEGPMPAMLSELFPTEIRCSGTSVVYQLQTIAGGLMPFIAAGMVAALGGAPWLLSGFLGVLAVVTVLSVAALPEVRGRDLSRDLAAHPS